MADLNAAHDYYTDTKIAWQIVHKAIQSGEAFSIRNTATGTVTTQADLAGKARGYVDEQLAEATFQQFISIFENYFFDLLRLWLIAYPQNLIGKKVDFKAVLDSPDKDAITFLVVNKELNEILYDRPTGWFAYWRTRPNSAARRRMRSKESRKPKLRGTCWSITGESRARPMKRRQGNSPATKTGRELTYLRVTTGRLGNLSAR